MLILLCISLSLCSIGSASKCVRHPPELELWRLPKLYSPSHYNVLMKFHMRPTNITIEGRAEVLLTPNINTNKIYFNIKNITISSVHIREVDTGRILTVLRFDDCCDREALVIYTERKLLMHYLYSVTFEYLAISGNLAGFYETWYRDEVSSPRVAGVTQFQATHARQAFPCFDEPEQKAVYNISIIHLKNMTALSNMPPIFSYNVEDDWKRTEFLPTLKMPTYLVAFFVGAFKKKSLDGISIYSQPRLVNTTTFALDVTASLLKNFGKLFTIDVALPKLDEIAIPHFRAGAMENWGLVTYREEAILFDEFSTATEALTYITLIVAHELSHSWFGNLVTCSWWSDLFLHEGFATLFEYVGLATLYPNRNSDVMFVTHSHFSNIDRDHDPDERTAIIRHPHSPHDIADVFNYASYSKAAGIFRMLLYHVGRFCFLSGLREYLIVNRLSSVTPEKLYSAFNRHYKENTHHEKSDHAHTNPIGNFMKNWTHIAGHPLLIVTRNYGDEIATLRQVVYLDTEFDGVFQIPITYTTGKERDWNPKTKHLMTSREDKIKNIADKDDWVLMNIEVVGFYRVQYDLKNWEMLHEKLCCCHQIFPQLNRAQILHDLGNFALNDPEDYMRLYLNTTRYLHFEREESPWSVFFCESRAFMIALYEDEDVQKLWIKYLLRLITPVYKELYWDTFTFEEHSDRESIIALRNKVIHFMCLFGDADCNSYALNLFRDWRTKNASIPVDFKKIAYCNGLYYGDEEDWAYMAAHFRRTIFFEERSRILSSMICAKKKEIFLSKKMSGIIFPLKDEKKHNISELYDSTMTSLNRNLPVTENVDCHDFYFDSSVYAGKNDRNYIYDIDQKQFEDHFYNAAMKCLKAKKEAASKIIKEFLEDWELNGDSFIEKYELHRSKVNETAYTNNGHLLMNNLM